MRRKLSKIQKKISIFANILQFLFQTLKIIVIWWNTSLITMKEHTPTIL